MSRTTGFRVMLVLMLFASLLPAGFTPSVQTAQANGAPTIKLAGEDSYTAQVGEAVPFSVTGFPANTWLLIQFRVLYENPVWLVNALTDANGNAGGSIVIPHAAGGTDHFIDARGGSVRDSAIIRTSPGSFADLAAWGNPNWPSGAWQKDSNPTRLTVASGDSVRFHFSGLTPGVTYSLFRWDGAQSAGASLSSFLPTASGFSGTSAEITESGVYGLAAPDGNRVTTTAIITVAGEDPPVIAYAKPSSVVVGNFTTITVSGFLANWDVDVRFEGGAWTRIATTDGTGSASGFFEVPAAPQGGKTLDIRTGALERTITLDIVPTIFTGRQSTFDFWTRFTGLGVPVDVSYFDGESWIALGTATPDVTGFAVIEWQITEQPNGSMPVRAVSNGVTILVGDALVLMPPDLPPVSIITGGDITVPATGSGEAFVALDGGESFDLDWWITNYDWEVDSGSGRTLLGSGNYITVLLPIGQHTVYLTVTDTNSLTDETSITVTVTGGVAPAAELSVDRATVSTNVAYNVVGFPGNAELTVTLERAGQPSRVLATETTSLAGTFDDSFVVPAAPGGAYIVRFSAGTTTIEQPFEIAPRISPTPTAATPGQTISLNLRGFAANDDVLIRWRIGTSFVTIGSARTSSTGSLTNKQIVVPVNAASGPNIIRVEGAITQQSNALNVTIPSVALSIPRTTVNNQVGYSLSNFPPNSYISITWRRLSGGTIDMGTAIADGYGAATGFIIVPATPGGPGQQITFAAGNVVVNVPFDVAPRVKVTPVPVVAGADMDVSLRGFARGEAVTIRWRLGNSGPFTTIGSGTTSNTGSANIAITVPNNAAPGTYQLRAETASFNQQTNVVQVVAGSQISPNEESSPTPTPEETPTPDATPEVTETPTIEPEPTEIPTETPVETPVETPTEPPTEEPTATPTEAPTEAPVEPPSETPTPEAEPTDTPVEDAD